jgi:hypothetical protein
MDLALHLGTTVEPLRRNMTERELKWWAEYTRKNWLPLQRIEWYLARITQAIAVTMGGAKDPPLSEFMLILDEPEHVTAEVIDLEEMKKAFGFNPRNRKAA